MFLLLPPGTLAKTKPPKRKKPKKVFNRGGLGFKQLLVKPFVLEPFRHIGRPARKRKHGKRSFYRTSLGFWPVPDLGYTCTAAVTLKLFKVSAQGQPGTEGTAAATLKMLSVFAEGRYGPDSDPARITLPRISVSADATFTAPLIVSHTLLWKYNSRGGGPVVSWLQSYAGSRQVQVKRAVPAETSDQEFDVSILQATTLALSLYATQDVTVYLNAGKTQTINLAAQESLFWTSDSGDPFPFTSDVSALFVSNNGVLDAFFTVTALILDGSN